MNVIRNWIGHDSDADGDREECDWESDRNSNTELARTTITKKERSWLQEDVRQSNCFHHGWHIIVLSVVFLTDHLSLVTYLCVITIVLNFKLEPCMRLDSRKYQPSSLLASVTSNLSIWDDVF